MTTIREILNEVKNFRKEITESLNEFKEEMREMLRKGVNPNEKASLTSFSERTSTKSSISTASDEQGVDQAFPGSALC